jgi:hypothetical protein
MQSATLSLVMEHRIEDIHEPEFAAYAPLASFEAFLPAQRLFGWVRLDADRLTDLLNTHDLIRLANVHVEEHRDGSTVAADETVIPRAEIIAVVASGPRGDAALRVPTRPHAVIVEAGDYRIGGHIHVPPGVEAMERWNGDGPMIPLTEAWLEYRQGGGQRRAAKTTVIVNRGSATDVEVLSDPMALRTAG